MHVPLWLFDCYFGVYFEKVFGLVGIPVAMQPGNYVKHWLLVWCNAVLGKVPSGSGLLGGGY